MHIGTIYNSFLARIVAHTVITRRQPWAPDIFIGCLNFRLLMFRRLFDYLPAVDCSSADDHGCFSIHLLIFCRLLLWRLLLVRRLIVGLSAIWLSVCCWFVGLIILVLVIYSWSSSETEPQIYSPAVWIFVCWSFVGCWSFVCWFSLAVCLSACC